MINKIEILSPGPECRRTKRIINSIKSILDAKQVEYELKIISNPNDFNKYRTWILPTVVINNQIVSRGYLPPLNKILENVK